MADAPRGHYGVAPGYWFGQETYCEIMCESQTIQPDLIKYQGKIKVKVTAMRGQFSTPIMVECCRRLQKIAEDHDQIKKIVILYFGDSDKSGNDIRNKVMIALKFYSGGGTVTVNGEDLEILASEDIEIPVEVELRHVAITPKQVKDYKLTGYQLEAFMTTEKRLKDFKNKILLPSIEGSDEIEGCWDEDTWLDNCPDQEYDYEAYGEEKPKDLDPDEYRPMMIERITVAFNPGWENQG